jgi:hypothetical protein
VGVVHFSLDRNLIAALRTEFPLDILVETGTFKGDTPYTLADIFPEIITIELSDQFFQYASSRLKHLSNVKVVRGDSPAVLTEYREHLKQRSVLYWLDAHWCGNPKAAGVEIECPLLDEIAAICLNSSSVIVIDDARLFLSVPPKPHRASAWPLFQETHDALRGLSSNHELAITNDVMIFYPTRAREAVARYGREYGVDWASSVVNSRQTNETSAQLRQRIKVLEKRIATLENANAWRLLRKSILKFLRQ